ncbi:hypothetical protein D3C87_1791170 [compost metagenome]
MFFLGVFANDVFHNRGLVVRSELVNFPIVENMREHIAPEIPFRDGRKAAEFIVVHPHIKRTVIIKFCGYRQYPLYNLLNGPIVIQPLHGAADIQHNADPCVNTCKIFLLQRDLYQLLAQIDPG